VLEPSPLLRGNREDGFSRIIDPMLYAPTIDGHRTEKHHVFCPSLPKFARNDPRLEEGGFDLT
jgi:hypothetical protein